MRFKGCRGDDLPLAKCRFARQVCEAEDRWRCLRSAALHLLNRLEDAATGVEVVRNDQHRIGCADIEVNGVLAPGVAVCASCVQRLCNGMCKEEAKWGVAEYPVWCLNHSREPRHQNGLDYLGRQSRRCDHDVGVEVLVDVGSAERGLHMGGTWLTGLPDGSDLSK